MRAAGGSGSGRALPWAACEGWEAKVAACSRLLAPHGGTVGVSEGEPLPEALLTVALLLLMPCEDFAALLRGDDDDSDDDDDGDGNDGDGGGNAGQEGKGGKEGMKGKGGDSRAGTTEGGAAGGAEDGAAGGAAGEGGVARVPMLDSSVLEGEPLLAAAVVQAIVGAVAAAEKRYPAEPTAAPSAVEGAAGAAGVVSAAGAAGAVGVAAEEVPGTRARRLVMARTMVCGELAALGATRRAALKLLVEIELGEDEEEGEEEDEEEGEEEGEEESEEEGDTHGAPPSAKVQRRA